MQKFIKLSIYLQIKLLLSRYSASPKWPKMTLQLFMLKSKFIKNFYTPILPEFMNFLKVKKEFTFLCNTVKTESYLTWLTQEDLFLKKKLQKYSKKFCQLWNIWNHKEFFIETLSVRTFCLIKIGMLNLSISDSPPNNRTKILVGLFVVLLPIQLQNSLLNLNIRLKLSIYGVWALPFTLCFKEHCLLMEKSLKIQKRTSLI